MEQLGGALGDVVVAVLDEVVQPTPPGSGDDEYADNRVAVFAAQGRGDVADAVAVALSFVRDQQDVAVQATQVLGIGHGAVG